MEDLIRFEFPYVDECSELSWGMVTIGRDEAKNILLELAAELGYNLIKCVED